MAIHGGVGGGIVRGCEGRYNGGMGCGIVGVWWGVWCGGCVVWWVCGEVGDQPHLFCDCVL